MYSLGKEYAGQNAKTASHFARHMRTNHQAVLISKLGESDHSRLLDFPILSKNDGFTKPLIGIIIFYQVLCTDPVHNTCICGTIGLHLTHG